VMDLRRTADRRNHCSVRALNSKSMTGRGQHLDRLPLSTCTRQLLTDGYGHRIRWTQPCSRLNGWSITPKRRLPRDCRGRIAHGAALRKPDVSRSSSTSRRVHRQRTSRQRWMADFPWSTRTDSSQKLGTQPPKPGTTISDIAKARPADVRRPRWRARHLESARAGYGDHLDRGRLSPVEGHRTGAFSDPRTQRS